ncbi:jg17856, partial [Pararge aegeria aegeria]
MKNDTPVTNTEATAPGLSVDNAFDDIEAVEMESVTTHPSNMTYGRGDLTAVRIQNGTKQGTVAAARPLVLASLYLPIEGKISTKEVMDLIEHCEDDDDTDLGRQQPTPHPMGKYQTIIDLTLASNNISDQIKNWHVCEELTLSDHRRISFELDLIKLQEIPEKQNNKIQSSDTGKHNMQQQTRNKGNAANRSKYKTNKETHNNVLCKSMPTKNTKNKTCTKTQLVGPRPGEKKTKVKAPFQQSKEHQERRRLGQH